MRTWKLIKANYNKGVTVTIQAGIDGVYTDITPEGVNGNYIEGTVYTAHAVREADILYELKKVVDLKISKSSKEVTLESQIDLTGFEASLSK